VENQSSLGRNKIKRYQLGVHWSLPLLPLRCNFDGALITRFCVTISTVSCMTNQLGSVAVVSNTDGREKQVCMHNVSHGSWVYYVRVKVCTCILCGVSDIGAGIFTFLNF
jgi:hypothetical protein